MPTGELAGRRGQACAVSLRQGVYWIGRTGNPTGTDKRQLDDGSLTTDIDTDAVKSMEKTADQKFLVLAAGSLKTVNTQTDEIVDSTYSVAFSSVCDDGAIISMNKQPVGYWLARHSVDGAGHFTNSAPVRIGVTIALACSPGSTFVVVVDYDEISSFAVSSLTVVDTLPMTDSVISIAFNPATSDMYLLQFNGKLAVYAFNSDGTFGVSKALTDVGTAAGTSVLEFAYGKLFVHAADQLLTYDAALNLKSNETIVAGVKTGICVSEGTTGFVYWALLSS
jgi:hypothetical protein